MNIFKNFLYIVKRYKTSSIFNILGLSAAFTVFIVVMCQVYFDFSYNHNFEKSNSLYYLSRKDGGDFYKTINMQLPEELKTKFPEIIDYTLIAWNNDAIFDIQGTGTSKTSVTMQLTEARPSIRDIFSLNIIAGNVKEALETEGKLLLPESVAKIAFGDQNPIGQKMTHRHIQKDYVVAAVYKDLPKNCSFVNGAYTYMPPNGPNNWSYFTYLEIPNSDIEELTKKINSKEFLGEEAMAMFEKDPKRKITYALTPITKMHLSMPELGSGNINSTLSLFAIGILILVIAYINYVNIAVATIPSRVKTINIHRILGSRKSALRLTIASEAVIFTIISFSVAILLINLIKDSQLSTLFDASLSPMENLPIIATTGIIVIILSFLIGCYPASYSTSFDETIAIKGSFALSPRGLKIRNVLIIIQFVATITLISVSAFIKIQNDYIVNYSWGIQKENVVYLPTRGLKSDVNVFANELSKNTNIKDWTTSGVVPGNVGMSWKREVAGKIVGYFTIWTAAPSMLRFFGVDIVAGSDFTPDIEAGKAQIIFNETFMKVNELDESIIGGEMEAFEPADIVGIAKDVNFQNLRMPISQMAFYVPSANKGKSSKTFLFLRIDQQDMKETISYIEDTWKQFNEDDFELKFLDTELEKLYTKERNMSLLISLFALITIIIAVMGVFGLIVLNIRYKIQEIGIRKVNGATEMSIVKLINKDIFILLGIAFIVAVPISYYLVERWLEGFAYRTPFHWWVFLLAGAVVFIITAITVSYQSWKAATTNPVESLKKD